MRQWRSCGPAPTRRDREAAPPARSGLADNLIAGEELRNLLGGGVCRIRAVHRILADGFRMQLADRAIRRLSRIGGAHDLTIFGDRVLALEHLHDHWAGCHELQELAEERPFAMHRIERLGLRPGHLDAPLRNDAQAGFLDQGVDRAGQVARGRVGFEDRKGALDRHRTSPSKACGKNGKVAGLYRPALQRARLAAWRLAADRLRNRARFVTKRACWSSMTFPCAWPDGC